MSTFQRVKGTRDLLPPETAVWAAVEDAARRCFGRYGYHEIRTPILEPTELFVRAVGEGTDVVGKEMYTFADRKGRSVTMRPENTASVVRAYLENQLSALPAPVKLFYIGPQFRYERPQKGRYRQFHQIGAELLGDAGPWSDVELLAMLTCLLRELGFERPKVLLNTLGDDASRAAWAAALQAYLRPLADRLGADSRRRLETNPLRILDTKIAEERELLSGAPVLEDFLSEGSRAHFDGVCNGLRSLGIRYEIEPRLVRGLDYYTHTVFEIVAEGLGAQNALCGGGRYDRLVEELGGAATPSLGFAIGLDRLIEVLPEAFRTRIGVAAPVMVAGAHGAGPLDVLTLAERLRGAGIATVAELGGRSLKAAFKQAERLGCRHVVLLGADEIAAGQATLKDLERRDQERLDIGVVIERLTAGG
jgi:histidyl-tRNA synthetase